jgi:putative membrane protein
MIMMFFGGWMIFIWVVVIGLIIWGIITLARRGGSGMGPNSKSAPLDIAKERYAKGEITKEEFERIKKDIM